MEKKWKYGVFPPGKALCKLWKIMRLQLLILFATIFHLQANPAYTQQNVSISFRNARLVNIVKEVERQSGVAVVYNSTLLRQFANVTVEQNEVTAQKAINAALKGTGLECREIDGSLVISRTQTLQNTQQASPIKVEGTVLDHNGDPIAGASIIVKATGGGTNTAANGKFTLTVPDIGTVLQISFVGKKSREITVIGHEPLTITLYEDMAKIDEVVITGIFNRSKEGFTGSANKITGEELTRFSSGNVLRAIEMIDPGFRMNMSNISGSNPSAIPEFQMRGQSNMGDYSTEEEVVLRGDLDTRPNQPLYVLDGIIGVSVTKIIDMDPAQIESITLLKDAAAMVIYGSRASNGVVVVETKAPATGKLRVSYNGNYKYIAPNLTAYNLLNAADKLRLEDNAGIYRSGSTPADIQRQYDDYTNRLLDMLRGVDTYWLSKPLKSAFTHRHGINLEGGDNALRYKIYLGLNQSPGVMKKTGVEGQSGSIDLRYRYKKLLVSNIMYVDYSVSDRTSPFGNFAEYTQINPYFRYVDENGQLNRILEVRYNDDESMRGISGYILNPAYDSRYKQKDRNRSFQVRNTFKVEYLPMDNLRLTLDASLSRVESDLDRFLSSNHSSFQGRAPEDKGSYNWSHTVNNVLTISFTGSYNKIFNEVHMLSAFAHFNLDQRKNYMVGNYATGFPNENMDEIFLGAKPVSLNGTEGVTRSLGMVGTVNYAYDQRYAVDFSARIDASSEFGRNNRFAPFWSTGVRWNINKEKFLKESKVVDELVLRLTYGVTGSQGFSPYQALQMYTYNGMMYVYQSSDVIGTIMQSMGNPDLKWQKTDAYNAGIDFTLFNNIINGRFEYYYKYTKNTLLSFSLAPSIGFTSITDNMGNITNEGYEGTLRIMPYNNTEKRINVSVNLTGGHNKNTIKKISNALRIRNEESRNSTKARPLPRYEEGYSMSRIWVVKSLGIDPYDGREVFQKRNGDMTNEYDAIDQIPYGDTEPKLRGSVNLVFNWQGLSLSMANTYQFGGQLYNQTLVDKVENANIRNNVDRRALTQRWQKQGDVTSFKSVSTAVAGQNTRASSRFVVDNNLFQFATINAQYRFDSRYNKFIRHLGLSSASVGVFLEDIGRLSTIKMERGINYPFASSVSLSLNLVF